MRAGTYVAWIGTGLWGAALLVYLFVKAPNPRHLAPGNLGSFLGGVFSPVAALWLVVGYLQQTAALRMQMRELSLQVGSTRRLAAVALRQLKRESARVRPVLLSNGIRWDGMDAHCWFKITQHGLRNLAVREADAALNVQPLSQTHFHPGDPLCLILRDPKPGRLTLQFIDAHDEQRYFHLQFNGTGLHVV